jgi:hypothetical protein
MSLVNDMLRDLDKRKQLPIQARRVSGTLNKYREKTRAHPLLWLLVVVLCLLAGLGGGYFLFDKSNIVPLPAITTQVKMLQPVPVMNTDSQIIPVGADLAIVEEQVSEKGFSLRINGSKEFDYSISNRSSNSMSLQLEGVDSYDLGSSVIDGLSVLQLPESTLLELELDQDVDFQVFNDSGTGGFDLVLTATYREH